MRTTLVGGVVVVVLLITGCAGGGETEAPSVAPTTDTVATTTETVWERLHREYHSDIRECNDHQGSSFIACHRPNGQLFKTLRTDLMESAPEGRARASLLRHIDEYFENEHDYTVVEMCGNEPEGWGAVTCAARKLGMDAKVTVIAAELSIAARDEK